MKNLLFLLLSFFSVSIATAQTPDSSKKDGSVFEYVERMPTYPRNIVEYLSHNLNYPESALENDIEGTVRARFIVTSEGGIRDVRIIKGIGYGCDEEVIRVISTMEKWTPGTQNGKAVDVYYNLPISFTIDVRKSKKRKNKK